MNDKFYLLRYRNQTQEVIGVFSTIEKVHDAVKEMSEKLNRRYSMAEFRIDEVILDKNYIL